MSAILDRYGVEKRRRTLTAEQVDELVRRYQTGWSLARIGERMNVNPTTVFNRPRERGIPTRDSQG